LKDTPKKNKSETAEQKASAPYRIVGSTPSGWRIGTELGDPRDPRGTLPKGLDHCLNGEYLSGKGGEHGEGSKEKHGAFALCELKPKSGRNDPRVVATLFGTSGSLQIEITLLNASTSLQSHNEKTEREAALRKAFVEICLQRAESAANEGIRVDKMVNRAEQKATHFDALLLKVFQNAGHDGIGHEHARPPAAEHHGAGTRESQSTDEVLERTGRQCWAARSCFVASLLRRPLWATGA
jgi:hypothetical protein